MTRTVADHSRDYRKRKAAKLARYEAALRLIAAPDVEYDGMLLRDIARQALNGGSMESA